MFRSNIMNMYGHSGEAWLESLPKMIAEIALKYGLSQLAPVSNLSYHYVMSGFQADQAVILKLGLDAHGFKREALALKAFSGLGAVKVLAQEEKFLLLGRAVPGESLKRYFPERENEAISIASNIIRRLHTALIPQEHVFPHITEWLSTLDKDWKIPEKYMNKARELRDSLFKTSTQEVLLHGDLHHDNILQQGDDWVVIDPKGVIGDPAYEVGAFIRNPMPDLFEFDNLQTIIHNRMSRFSEILELPAQRIRDWCFVQAVLAWIWNLEDGGDDAHFKACLEIFDKK